GRAGARAASRRARGQCLARTAARSPAEGREGEAQRWVVLAKGNPQLSGRRPPHRRNRRGGRQREAATLYPGFRRVAIVFRRISCVQGEPLLYALSSPRQTGWLVGPCSRRPVRPG